MDKAFKSLLEGFAKQGVKVTVIEPQKDEDTLESKVDEIIEKMNVGGVVVRFDFSLELTKEGIKVESTSGNQVGGLVLADILGIEEDEIKEIFSKAQKEFAEAVATVDKKINQNLEKMEVEVSEERRNCSKNCGH